MPLAPAEFLSPQGELEPGLFPKDTAGALAARLQAYIDDGYADSEISDLDAGDIDEAVEAFVYVKSYDAVLLRMANTPDTSIADEGSVSISAAQIATIRGFRDKWQMTLDAVIEGGEPPPSGSSIPESTQARVSPTW